jgi:hypothetical protein
MAAYLTGFSGDSRRWLVSWHGNVTLQNLKPLCFKLESQFVHQEK